MKVKRGKHHKDSDDILDERRIPISHTRLLGGKTTRGRRRERMANGIKPSHAPQTNSKVSETVNIRYTVHNHFAMMLTLG